MVSVTGYTYPENSKYVIKHIKDITFLSFKRLNLSKITPAHKLFKLQIITVKIESEIRAKCARGKFDRKCAFSLIFFNKYPFGVRANSNIANCHTKNFRI